MLLRMRTGDVLGMMLDYANAVLANAVLGRH
jgi:hypothetical protein